MNRVILLRTVHTRKGGGGAEHIFDIDIKHQCLTQHIFSSILYLLKKGVGGTTYVLEYTSYSKTNFIHGHSQIFSKMLSKVFFVIKQIVYCRYWQNDRTACLFPISFNRPGVQVYTRQQADRRSGERSGAALESGVHPAPCPLSCLVQLKDYKTDQEKDQVLTQNQVLPPCSAPCPLSCLVILKDCICSGAPLESSAHLDQCSVWLSKKADRALPRNQVQTYNKTLPKKSK